jgi:hypothetical protein
MVVKEPNHLVSVHELAVFESLVSVEFRDQRRQLVSRQSLSFKRRPARARLCTRTVRQEAAYPPFPLLGFVRLVSVGGALCAKSSTSAVSGGGSRRGDGAGKEGIGNDRAEGDEEGRCSVL